MALVHYNCDTDETALAHVCEPCNRELGRVRGTLLINPSFDVEGFIAKLKGETAETAVTAFESAITSGDIILIPETTGTFDGGAAQTGDGYGDAETRLLGYLYTLNFNDPSFASNVEFWEAAEKRSWKFAWRTESLIHFSDKAGTLQAIAPVEQDLTSAVVHQVTATWKSQNKPRVAPLEHIEKYFSGCWKPSE